MEEITEPKCWLCGEKAETGKTLGIDILTFDCTCCGRYALTRGARFLLSGNSGKAPEKLTQGHINCAQYNIQFHRNNFGLPFWTNTQNYANLKSQFESALPVNGELHKIALDAEKIFNAPVDHSQKATRLLEVFARNLGKQEAFALFTVDNKDLIETGIVSRTEAGIILGHLKDKRLINFTVDGKIKNYTQLSIFLDTYKINITVDGWNSLRILNTEKNNNKVFIATAFNWPESDETRIEAIAAIKRACLRLGYVADTVSQNHTGNITDKIISEIKSCKFLIAEFTYHNRGVYFESGYARGLGKEVFHVVMDGFTEQAPEFDKENKRIHFDLAQVIFRKWKRADELENELYDWIKALVGEHSSLHTN
ncbi:MAG: hypothetical protein R3A80_03825 [Bdellovibrionota bacterium]